MFTIRWTVNLIIAVVTEERYYTSVNWSVEIVDTDIIILIEIILVEVLGIDLTLIIQVMGKDCF